MKLKKTHHTAYNKTEVSGAYSVTDNVILLGDYNLNYLNKIEKSKLDVFVPKYRGHIALQITLFCWEITT